MRGEEQQAGRTAGRGELLEIVPAVVEVVGQAGAVIEEVRRSTSMEAIEKSGGRGPVTRADREADDLLRRELLALLPAAWLSEETADDPARLAAERVWVVDPLDGTKDFIAGVPEYAVAVALVERGRPVLAVVHNPARLRTVWAVQGAGCTLQEQGARRPATVAEGRRLLASRTETKLGEFAPFQRSWEVVPVGSIEYKLALVAVGEGAATFSRGPKHEWDVCAGALLVEEAGGLVTDLRGDALVFNRPKPKTWGIMAGAPEAYRRARAAVEAVGESDRMNELKGT